MTISEKLAAIQAELKAPKNQRNSFGGYNYRSCEDILEAVKPLLAKYEATIVLSDEMVQIGERYYIKATATFASAKNDDTPAISNTAYAREAETKKGMDEAQITGTASSYSRKYALNGLLLIDDAKDADTDEYAKTTRANANDSAADDKPKYKNGLDIKAVKSELQELNAADDVRKYYARYVEHNSLTTGQSNLLKSICEERVKQLEPSEA